MILLEKTARSLPGAVSQVLSSTQYYVALIGSVILMMPNSFISLEIVACVASNPDWLTLAVRSSCVEISLSLISDNIFSCLEFLAVFIEVTSLYDLLSDIGKEAVRLQADSLKDFVISFDLY